MNWTSTDIKTLKAAAAQRPPAFVDTPTQPVDVTLTTPPDRATRHEIARRYHQHGFALLTMRDTDVTPDKHLKLTYDLGLGEPFIPPLYSMGGKTPSLVATISAARNADTQDSDHPSFGAATGQALHCDGTLQPPGLIKATMLSCRSPAAEGGDSGLFDSVSAFARLLDIDTEAALTLTSPSALLRRANINGCSDEALGPAFTIAEGRIIGRYCETDTDTWIYPEGTAGAAMRRGVQYLRAASRNGQSLYRTERLAANQAIVFDNTRLSHSRSSYRDNAQLHRCLYRTLHVRHPPWDKK